MAKYFMICVSIFFMTPSMHCASTPQDPFAPCRPEIVQKIYQMLKDVRDFCIMYDITYWVDGGTLLGAVRHRGLIPWDDDLDLCMFEDDEARFISLFPALHQAGYRIIKMSYGYKIWHIDGLPIENRPFLYPGCDIFIVQKSANTVFYRVRFPKELSTNFEMKLDDIFPLRQYVFGPILVAGPRNPFPYLHFWYGDTYMTEASKEFDHEHDRNIDKVTKPLTNYAPIRPLTKLVDNIQKYTVQQWYPFGSIPQPVVNQDLVAISGKCT